MPASALSRSLCRWSATLAVLSASLAPLLAVAADDCPATAYLAVERKTGVCHTYPGVCRAPTDAIPVQTCPIPDLPLDLDGLWRVKSGASDGSKPRFSLLSVRITGQQAALVFLVNDAWEAFVAPFDPATNSAQVISWDKAGYNGWHLNFIGEYNAVLKGDFCTGAPLGGATNPFVTPSAASGNGLPLAGTGCRVPEGTSLQLEKLL
jgi:hypothetical protein